MLNDSYSQCGKPKNVSVTVNGGSVTFGWDDMMADYYYLRYRLSGTTSWNVRNNLPTNSHVETGLNNGTYEYQIRSRCNGSWVGGYTTSTTFTVVEGDTGGGDSVCGLPTNVSTTVNGGSVTFGWDDMMADYYYLRYRLSGTTSWNVRNNLPTNSHVETGLNAGTYHYQIRSRCSGAWVGGYTTSMSFIIAGTGGGSSTLWTDSTTHISYDGKVVIGSTNNIPNGYKLYVTEGVLAEKVKVALESTSAWADFVFEEDYKLTSLNEIEKFVISNKHLPNVPSAEEVVLTGIDVAEMDAILLRQIEELWLHLIDIKKENMRLIKLLNNEN